MNGAFMFFFTCFWSILVLFFDGGVGRELWKQFDSSHYPFTMGQVTRCAMTSNRTSKGRTIYGVDIGYRYVVNNHTYNGSRFRYICATSNGSGFRFASAPSGYDWATATVKAHPAGSQIAVYFNPSNPQDAVLSPDLNGGDLMILLFLMPFNLVMVGFWTGIGGWLRERILKPVAGGVRIIVEGPQTRVRLPQYGALVWSMIAMGGLSFVSIFVVGFASSFQPSIPAALLTLFVVIGTGAGIYIWQWGKIHSGDLDLILDETSTTIALPETYGRKQRVTVNRSEIEKLTVEQIEHRTRKGISYTYAPTLWLRRNDNVETQKLADWGDRKKAEAFEEWLRQRLNLADAPAERV